MPESPEAREKRLARHRAYHARHREEHNDKAKKWREEHPGAVAEMAREWRVEKGDYTRNWMRERREGLRGPYGPNDGPDWQARSREHWLEKKRESTNRRRRDIALEAFTHYSGGDPRCYCCGETQVLLLALDHIDGGGNKHRKELKVSHQSHWAKRNGWPAIFRVACHSCNMGAHLNGGVCPHQDRESA
jgi:hypothetical protein